VAEIGSAQAEAEGAGTVVPAAGGSDGAGAQPGTLASETEARAGETGALASETEAHAGDTEVQGDAVAGPPVAATGFLQRAVIRRRARFLSRRRELALHDLGGFAFESHRLGQPREELLAQKLSAISELDDELAALQGALDRHEEVAVLREPGISSCPQCSTIHDSAARYCPTCGRPTAGKPS
jgi:rubrerythrin